MVRPSIQPLGNFNPAGLFLSSVFILYSDGCTESSVLRILKFSMCLGLLDPDPLVRGTVRIRLQKTDGTQILS